MGGPKDNKNHLLRLDGPSHDELLKAVTPEVAERNNKTRESGHSQSEVIHYASLCGHWMYFCRCEIRKGYISMHWNAGDLFTARQTDCS